MPFEKKKTTTDKFKVGNTEIIIGDKYVLDNRFDSSAPEALQKIESTKLPFTGSGIIDCVHFDNEKGIYDTGFYKDSFCLSHYDNDGSKDELVTIYNKQIKEPFEKLKNIDLSPNEESKFWENYRYEAHVNKEFDTTKPSDLMELFQIIVQGVACEKNEKNQFYKQNAQFTISNPSTVKNKQKLKSKVRYEAIKRFSTLAAGDKDKLDLVLEFIGRDSTSKIAASDLELIYFEIFNDKNAGLSLAETFLEACDLHETADGKLQMEFFYAINKLFKFRKIQKNNRGYSTLDGTYLGLTFQDVSKFCLNEHSVQNKAISALIDENPNVRREV